MDEHTPQENTARLEQVLTDAINLYAQYAAPSADPTSAEAQAALRAQLQVMVAESADIPEVMRDPATLQLYIRLMVSLATMTGVPPAYPDLVMHPLEAAILIERLGKEDQPQDLSRRRTPSDEDQKRLHDWATALATAAGLYSTYAAALVVSGSTAVKEWDEITDQEWQEQRDYVINDLTTASAYLAPDGTVGGEPVPSAVLFLFLRVLASLWLMTGVVTDDPQEVLRLHLGHEELLASKQDNVGWLKAARQG